MKGIILAGGSGSRLHPLTITVSKQLLPIYDKPMIYYPLSILMLLGIKDILLISTHDDIPRFKKIFKNGSKFGINIEYKVQEKPNGLAEAFILGKDFIGSDEVCLILGDNLFYGSGYLNKIRKNIKKLSGSLIFGYEVNDPERYGVVEFDKNFNAISIEEKPSSPKSNFAIPGLYFYDNTVVEKALKLKPSKRNELEITDLNKLYLEDKKLKVQILGRGVTWFDTGTFSSLLQASSFIESVQKRKGQQIASIEEIAFKYGYISKEEFKEYLKKCSDNNYYLYLKKLIDEF
tara:strand:+ start:2410 stop:3279 length:870 start_codon:yes stop_codon:yes gene_type:complete